MSARKGVVVVAALSIMASACGGKGDNLEATIAAQNTRIALLDGSATALSTASAPETPIPSITPAPVATVVLPSAPADTTGLLTRFYPYHYELKDQGDGWSDSTVQIGLMNVSDRLISGDTIDVSGAIIETQEGKTYPVEVMVNSPFGGALPTTSVIYSTGADLIPPNFRLAGSVAVKLYSGGYYREAYAFTYFLKFRVATVAHPLRINFPSRPDLTIDLTTAIPKAPPFPADSSFLRAKPLSELAGRVLADDPGGLRVTLTGRQMVVNELSLEVSIANMDKLDSHTASFVLPLQILFYASGLAQITNTDPVTVEVGPGQVKQMPLQLIAMPDYSLCGSGIYAVSVDGNGQYSVYDLTGCGR